MAASSGMLLIKTAEISKALGTAHRYLEPYLQALVHAGILMSVRGHGGGYRIGRTAEQINLADILLAIKTDKDGYRRSRDTPSITEIVASQAAEGFDARWMEQLREITIADLLRPK